jgi:hypothetical protein
MGARRSVIVSLAISGVATLLAIAGSMAQSHDGGRVITIGEDRPDLNFVGQFINAGPNSHQFGYISKIEGVENVFNSDATKNESTAMFTFSTAAVNILVLNNGPIRVVNRAGTTTIYYHPEGGATFSDPSTFEAGTPIQVSDYQQQVVFDPSTPFPFTTTHLNTITSTASFVLNGELLRLGCEHNAFRTHYLGRANMPGLTPTGWFAGYGVGVSRDQK